MASNQQKQKKTQKKQTTHQSSTHTTNVVNVLAFCALAAAAILLLIGPILRWIIKNTGGGAALAALNMIAQYCLLVAIAIPAWHFVRGKSKGWKAFYLFVLIVYVAATVCGVVVGL